MFAACYLGLEMCTKLLATGIFLGVPQSADAIVFSTYSVIALLSALAATQLSDLRKRGTWDFNSTSVMVNVASTARLLHDDTRLLLMVPFQAAFGFASSFVPFYIFGTVIWD